ncbi:hypothetical protein C2E23DRAFT_829726 [Lenzites betulinus]|nr:hypothetical protein C2E23DRAFT_829726 [Lenzites betulinus]
MGLGTHGFIYLGFSHVLCIPVAVLSVSRVCTAFLRHVSAIIIVCSNTLALIYSGIAFSGIFAGFRGFLLWFSRFCFHWAVCSLHVRLILLYFIYLFCFTLLFICYCAGFRLGVKRLACLFPFLSGRLPVSLCESVVPSTSRSFCCLGRFLCVLIVRQRFCTLVLGLV